ncbi:MAG: DUF5076 domain-containing protein [Phycisphaerales bacterium]|nr:DUF5076 domain-containing protein [Phycisphaerales bacterium]
MSEIRELDVPDDALEDNSAHEVLRVWTGKTEYVCISGKLYGSPATWGHLLCQIARHVARAYSLNEISSEDDAAFWIREQFNASWDEPDETTGELVDDTKNP